MEYSTIKSKDLTVILKTLSGTFASVRDLSGREYLWQGDKAYWGGQAPVCFPVCGGLRDFKAVTLNGKKICMKRHGIVRKREFRQEDSSNEYASFVLESDPETMAQYPFPFLLRTKYRLDGYRITVTYEVLNTGTGRMPFMIGGHPAWKCPLDTDENYSDYELKFEKEEGGTVPLPVNETGLLDENRRYRNPVQGNVLPLSHELFSEHEIVFDEVLKSRAVILQKKGNPHKGLKITFTDFPYLVLWSSGNGGPFLAIEPWTGLSTCSDEDDIFEHKRNCLCAEPGETRRFSFSVEILN